MADNLNVEALHQLIRVIKSVPGRKFDLRSWRRDFYHVGQCGCAVGWAAEDEWFRSHGFRLHQVAPSSHGLALRALDVVAGMRHFSPVTLNEFGDVKAGYAAVREFFGLTISEASHLFSPHQYAIPNGETAKQAVIRRVHKLLQRHAETQPKPLPKEIVALLERAPTEITGP